jgi:hypothetical protein
MSNNSLEGTRTFRRAITSADGTGIIEILNCAEAFTVYSSLESTYFLERSFYLEALSGAVYLPSLQTAPFPDIYPEMTAAEKIAAMIKIEEDYPFLGLRFHARKGAGSWSTLATALLQNRGRETQIPFTIPYLTVNQLKLLSPDDRLGISIINYGDGVLGAGDYINLEGDFRFEIQLIEKPVARTVGVATPYGIDVGSVPIRFRNTNANRALLYATNAGNFNIWIAGTSSGLTPGTGMLLAANGGTLSLTDNLNGELWAVAEGDTSRVAGVEASYV